VNEGRLSHSLPQAANGRFVQVISDPPVTGFADCGGTIERGFDPFLLVVTGRCRYVQFLGQIKSALAIIRDESFQCHPGPISTALP
jgi:hypothetical protein